MSGQLPNRAGSSMLPGQQQQQPQPMNTNYAMSNQMQNPSVHRSMDPELLKARRFMSEKIFEFFISRQQQAHEIPQRKMLEIVKKLEEGLFKGASTKEDYMNISTLESRLQALIKRPPLSNQNQQYSQVNSSSSSAVGTMIPTPGMPTQSDNNNNNNNINNNNSMGINNYSNNGSSSMGAFIPTPNGPLSLAGVNGTSSDGPFSNGYQQSNSSFTSGGNNNSVTSMGTQMIPTPGLINENMKNNIIINNVGGFQSDESSQMVTQQKQTQGGGQNSRILRNLGSHMAGGLRSTLQQTTYGFSNGGVGIIGNNLQQINNQVTSDGFLSGTHYANSVKQLDNQHQRPLMHNDRYGMSNANSSGSGNLYVPVSMTNSQSNMNISQQMKKIKTESIPSQNSFSENLVHSHQNQSHQFQQNQFVQQQNQFLLKNNIYNQSQPSDLGIQVKSEPTNEAMHSQVPEQIQFSQNSIEEHSRNTNTLPPNSQAQTTQQLVINQTQFLNNSQTDYTRVNSDTVLQSQWYPKSNEPNVQTEFRQRITSQDGAQKNNLLSDASNNIPTRSEETSRTITLNRERQFKNQTRWLLFLLHARKCQAPEGTCLESNCVNAQKLLKHIQECNTLECLHPRCYFTKRLIDHNKSCRDGNCPVCIPVKNFIATQVKAAYSNPSLPSTVAKNTSVTVDKCNEDFEPDLKRLKIAQPSQTEMIIEPVPQVSQELQLIEQIKPEVTQVKMEFPITNGEGNSRAVEMKNLYTQRTEITVNHSITLNNPTSSVAKQEIVKIEKEVETKQESKSITNENPSGSKSGKTNIKGVSLIELFTPEQVREHIRGLRQWIGQSKAKAEKNQAMEHSMSENSCQLCAVEKLTFEPPPTYCSPCGARIKRNAMYYTIGAGDTRHYFCIPCYNESRGDTISVDGTPIPKARLEKKKNDEETEEWWVQCDRCEAWQHQICALFNGRRNDGGQAEYTCPNCYMAEVEKGERSPLPQSSVLGAVDLPKTILSDHIEQRLAQKLKQERLDRARFQGKTYDEVPGADGLVVRVVSSVDKKLEVKPRFLDIFKEDNYPSEFAYKSKVLLLFQKIEGVEVCLFGMYVQEFGSECLQPNHRRVYLSYLDSVKYFRPEIKTVTGEALRTYVYHEILIGYLEYCKLRGFTSCYIWACPPLKGEDYILYCHPEIQKTPKSDKLREWYLAMLRKAGKENIVVELTNFYDHFFMSSGECKAKVTAARLPYFDGDYWPGAAEDMIFQLQQEEEGRKHNKKGTFKKTITKRALKASGQTDLSGNASKDIMLMHKLGETISPMKEDFIMVHLQSACTHCCVLMVDGNRWVCNICKNFQLCDKCYEAEQKREDRERHPIHHKEKHGLYPIENNVQVDTKDKDDILESEFFDTRQAFLSLCQGNHYQYDTLRRAKHSSMMVLYHLHNPTAPAFVITCNACHLDIEAGQGWRCETCSDYDVCNACYQKDGGIDHPHKLTNHPSIAERDAQNKEARQMRVVQLRKMLDLLVHASQCRSPHCQYPNCRKVKGLFRHGIQCKVRASGGCVLCKRMWYLLQLHARACKESQCHVPRCRDLKEHLRRLQQQSDSRRRAAVMEMMRQRAAEVAGSS